MKIAHYSCVFPPYKGGIGRVAYEYCRALSELGHEVTAIYPRLGVSQDDLAEQAFNLDRRASYLRYGNAAYLRGLFSDLDKYEVLHLHYPFFGTAEPLAIAHYMRRSKCKLFLHYHMDTPSLSGLASLLDGPMKSMFPFIFSRCVGVSAASLDYVENSDIRDLYQQYEHKFFAVPFGVSSAFLTPNMECPNGAEKRFIFVGGMDTSHAFKGIRVLLEAISLIDDKSVCLDLIGDGNLRAEYEKYAQDLHISDSVKFLGAMDDFRLIAELDSHSTLVLPSVSGNEAFGLVLIEAMSRARAVIASDLPGVRSVFRDGLDGFLFEAGNSQMLAEKIKKACDINLARQMGNSGYSFFQANYSWLKAAKRLSELYSSL